MKFWIRINIYFKFLDLMNTDLDLQKKARGSAPLRWTILLYKKENKLNLLWEAHLLLHAGEWVVGAGQVARQVGEGLLHQVLHLNPLIPGKEEPQL